MKIAHLTIVTLISAIVLLSSCSNYNRISFSKVDKKVITEVENTFTDKKKTLKTIEISANIESSQEIINTSAEPIVEVKKRKNLQSKED